MNRPSDPDDDAASEMRERADRLRAMGGVLRDVPIDETDDGWGQSSSTPADSGSGEAALRREAPPHHGA